MEKTVKPCVFASRAQADCLLDQMEELVRIVTPEGEISFQNRAMIDFFDRLAIDQKQVFPVETADPALASGHKTMTELCFHQRVYSLQSTPLTWNGQPAGVMQVFRDITIPNRITTDVFLTNQKLQKDMRLAHLVQVNMLPKLTHYEGLHFDFRYQSSTELSGDFFDLIPLSDKRIGVYITDVVGHGISASLLTMFIRQTMRFILREEAVTDPAQVFHRLNSYFSDLDFGNGQYFTMFYGLFDLEEGTLRYANAGHNGCPLVGQAGHCQPLAARGRMISPLFRDYAFQDHCLALEPGQSFLFYTDGITERQNADKEDYGIDRLAASLEAMEERGEGLDFLLKGAEAFASEPQQDDIALLYIRYDPKEAGRASQPLLARG